MKRRVVITGMGAVTPIGNDVTTFWDNIKNGVCGIDLITSYDATNQRVKLAAEIKGLNFLDYIPKSELRKMDLFTKYAVIASKEAFISSGIILDDSNSERCGIILSSGIGGIGTISQEQTRGCERGYDKVSPYFIPMSIVNIAAGTVAINHGIKGMCNCVVTACAGGTNAIGDAFRYIRDGYSEMMLCGGAEASITPLAMGGFTSLRALSESTDKKRASIPFDAKRNGFVMGEGAGMLFLEEYEHALQRNATIYGEIIGYGVSCDAYHITAPDPTGSGACKSMLNALKDASLSPTSIDYINAHGTSTPLNDKGETIAVKNLFGEHSYHLYMSSTKSMTGHLLGASGAIEAIATTMALKDGFIPPTINYQVPDEECDLSIVPNAGIEKEIQYAMSNSLGFGGHNATLLFQKF
ncbi:MAG: beta-ketoacyl-ACP synthase II [Eubacteriales bacterium]